MSETLSKRTFASETALNPRARLESTKTSAPALDQVTPELYARLNEKQREELVHRLIDFLKSF
jgi:hypothetical protein